MYDLSLFKLCFSCAKQNTAVMSASDACSLLAKYTLPDLDEKRPSSLIINLEEVIRSFLVWSIYFIFFLPVVGCIFLQE